MSSLPYIEHLSDADLALLAAVGEAGSTTELLDRLRDEPGYLDALLGRESLFAALFASREGDALLRASPFLCFAVLVHRVTRDLGQVRFVEEWIGPGRRVPMFEVAGLREFVSDRRRRLFLAELLASYTHVASGSIWMQTARGWRRRRFSELDPVRLLELLETLPEHERPAVYQRLGDLSLFLTGVFPDYAETRLLPTSGRRRLQRAFTRGEGGDPRPSTGTMSLLEQLGERAYRLAWQETSGGTSNVLADVAEGFGEARRILNVLTDRYLFPYREQWFSLTGP